MAVYRAALVILVVTADKVELCASARRQDASSDVLKGPKVGDASNTENTTFTRPKKHCSIAFGFPAALGLVEHVPSWKLADGGIRRDHCGDRRLMSPGNPHQIALTFAFYRDHDWVFVVLPVRMMSKV